MPDASPSPDAKPGRTARRLVVTQWSVVVFVGAVVIAIVLGLNLIPRLNAGQKVLNAARPAFTSQRIAGDEAGISFISRDVNMADPLIAPQGGAAAEVPALVAYVAGKEHVSDAKALALLQKLFPHTTALLEAIPLTRVTSEIPHLVAFLARELKLSPSQVLAALKANFPALAEAITNLPAVTNNWYSVPGTESLTRFDGSPVRSVPAIRTYFGSDVIPALKSQQSNFQALDGTSTVDWIAPLLLAIGIIVVLFGAFMIVRNLRGVSRGEALWTASVVPVVGVFVLVLTLALSLSPRVVKGQHLLDGLKPAFAAQRVVGDRAAVSEVTAIVNTENPIMTPAGGAAAEVPKLIAFVSQKTGLSTTAVLAALSKNFPHTTALLEALPLSAVSAELPKVVATLGSAALPLIPKLAQTIADAPYVTSGWNDIPGLGAMTRFDGSPVRSMPQLQTYLSADLVPVLETQRAHYDELTGQSNIDWIGIIVLMIAIVVVEFGLLMVYTAHKTHPLAGPDNASPVPSGRVPGGAVAH